MANLTAEQIAKVVTESIFSSRQWAQAGREFAQGMKGAQGFSSQNKTGVAGGRGQADEKTYRDAEKTLASEIKLRKLANAANEKTTKMMNAFADAVKVVHPRMRTFKNDIALISNTLDKHFEQISDTFDTAAKEIKFWEKQAKKTGISLKDLQRNLNQINRQLEDNKIQGKDRYDLEMELMQLEKKRAQLLEKSATSIERSAKAMATASAALAALGAGAVVAGRQMVGDIAAQRRFGTPGGMLSQQAAAYTSLRGIDPELMSEMFARNRRSLISMGGHEDMEAFMKQIGGLQRELTDLAGDPTAAFKFQMEMYENLTNAGIRPTESALREMLPIFNKFQKSMGMTTDEFNELQRDISANAAFQVTLMGLNKRERMARVESINRLIELNRNMGMTAEQAKAAALSIQELGAKGPRERFKKVAQMQALAAAAGIQMSEEARQGFLRGRSATEQQQDAMQKFQDQMGTTLAEVSATMGGSATEFALFGMLDRIGGSMEDFRAHVTALGEPAALAPDFNQQFKTMIEGMSGFESALNDLATTMQQVSGMISSAAGGGTLSSMASSAAGAFLGARGLGWLGKGAKGLLGAGRGVLSSGWGLLRAAPAALGGLLPAAGATVGGASAGAIGGAVAAGGAVGYGAGWLIDNAPRLFGFDQISTNIVDGLERLFGAETMYGLQEDSPITTETKRTADTTAQMVAPTQSTAENTARILEAQERANQLAEISLQLQQGMISNQQARDRILEMNLRSQSNFLVSQ